MVPLLMAAAMWVVTRSLMMVGFMAFSFVYVLASGIESRRESRKADRHGVADFREELAEVEEELDLRIQSQERRDEMQHPATLETIGWLRPLSHRLWERSGSHPHPLAVRLGVADLPPDDPAMGRVKGRPALREEVAGVLEHNDPQRRPLTIDLSDTGGLAIIGDQHIVTALGGSVVAQLTMLTPPDQLSIDLSVPTQGWQWAHWLPHRRPGATNALAVFQRLDTERLGTSERPVLWMAPDTIGLPGGVRAVVQIDAAGRSTLQLDNSQRRPFALETQSPSELESAARRVAGLEPGATTSASALPAAVSLAEIGTALDAETMAKRWAEPQARGIAVPFGRMAGGGVLTLDLVADGPHALIGGTTGSGKSELLRTMLSTIAANHSPERVNLLLVDYKGGAAFGPLADLPHCVGLVTDLGTAEVARTLTALRSELHRRERILEANGAGDLRELDDLVRPPSLLVVIDEFATLVADVPDFLDGVLDVAQRGRSLGIHMLLATQRPTGVVSDAVKANTSLRIALRLPDADDSTDVVNSAAASELPREIPGRALIRLGHDTLLAAQVAYSGGPLRGEETIEVRPLGSPRAALTGADGAPTELAAVVAAAREAFERMGLDQPRRPLPPPLPEHLPMAELMDRNDVGTGADPAEPLPIGLVDRPSEQIRAPLFLDPLADGGILVVGGPRSGASSALVSIAASLDAHGGWDVHAIDADGGLANLRGLGSLRTVTRAGDHEVVRRLIDSLLNEPVERPTMLLLNGFAAFEEQQAAVNRGEATDLLLRLANEGRANNVVVAVSTRQRTQLPFALLNALGERIVLRAVDEDQATMLDAPKELADRSLPPGRGWVRGDWVQIAQPATAPPNASCPGPPRLPTDLTHSQLAELKVTNLSDAAAGALAPPLGIGAQRLGMELLDLTTGHAIVAGPPRSGRTATLNTIQHAAQVLGVACYNGIDTTETLEALIACGSDPECPPTLGLIDNFDDFAEESEIDELVREIVRLGRECPLRLVVSGDAQRLSRCFSDGLSRLRSSRTGILLGPDAHERGELLHQDLRARGDIPALVGRGWVVDPHGARIVQIAQVT